MSRDNRYNFFIVEVVKAHVAAVPKHPETLHDPGEGVFMVSGKIISRAHFSARRFCEGAEPRCLCTLKLSGRRLSSAGMPGSTLVIKWP